MTLALLLAGVSGAAGMLLAASFVYHRALDHAVEVICRDHIDEIVEESIIDWVMQSPYMAGEQSTCPETLARLREVTREKVRQMERWR